ncbi:hypothetical protein WN944_025143 [Citrus x changshan-huyou]|uniref:NAC domain-containing protein n=1 Tax=Citrus x changshan-huyou TaxID=2935761 RepID=A0AAP0QGD4_9ROSI
MSCQNCVLPSGFKIAFVPTDEQIIRDYLFNKVYGNPLPSDEAIVDHCDLYDESDDWKKHFEERGENILYFFTPLKKKSENGSKIDRTTKCGATWKSQTEKRILDGQSQQHIGSKKNLTFLPKNDDQVKGGISWVMYQFRLDGILLNNANDIVVCRVSKNVKNKKESKDKNNINNARPIMAPKVMASSNHMLPSGYKILFEPSDEQIIRDYLFGKLCGNGLPSNEAITECSLYDGCHIWRKQFQEKGENMLYFFIALRRKSEKDPRIDRVTKCGTWKSQKDNGIHWSSSSSSSSGTSHNNEVLIGSRKNFSFIPKKCCCDDHREHDEAGSTTWVMHEYRLGGNVLKQYCKMKIKTECDYVICRIKKKVKNEEENKNDSNAGPMVATDNHASRNISEVELSDSHWSFAENLPKKNNENDSNAGPMVATDNHVSRNMSEVELSDSYWSFAENLPNLFSLSEDAINADYDYFNPNLCICLEDLEDDDDKRVVNGMQEQYASASIAIAPVVSAARNEQDQSGRHKRFKAADDKAGSLARAKGINGLDYKTEETGYLEDLVRSCAYYCGDRRAAGS